MHDSMRAIDRLLALCRERHIPCYVVVFPLLIDLSDSYAYIDVHERLGRHVNAGGGGLWICIRRSRHESEGAMGFTYDQHPNEKMHAIARTQSSKRWWPRIPLAPATRAGERRRDDLLARCGWLAADGLMPLTPGRPATTSLRAMPVAPELAAILPPAPPCRTPG